MIALAANVNRKLVYYRSRATHMGVGSLRTRVYRIATRLLILIMGSSKTVRRLNAAMDVDLCPGWCFAVALRINRKLRSLMRVCGVLGDEATHLRALST